MSTKTTQDAATSTTPAPIEPASPFYRQPWFLMGLGFASLFFWPLAIIPAIAVWTGPLQFYLAPGKRIQNETAAKVIFTSICVAYMGWYGLKSANIFGAPSCSDNRTMEVVRRLITQSFIEPTEGRVKLIGGKAWVLPRDAFETFLVQAIRTTGKISANGGYHCAAQVEFLIRNADDSIETPVANMNYTVEPVDNSDQFYVRVQLLPN